MSDIVYRSDLNRELKPSEVDGNFIELDTRSTDIIQYRDTIQNLIDYNGQFTTVMVKDSIRGGIFTYSETGTVDNGITFPATGKGSGYWVRQYDRSKGISVGWYGAVADGVTDDTVAIQAALSAKLDVNLLAGRHIISTTLVMKAAQSLKGKGKANTQLYCVTAGINVIQGENYLTQANLYNNISDFRVDMDTPHLRSVGSVGIQLGTFSYSTISEVLVRGFQYGIQAGDITGGAAGGFYNTVLTCEVANCSTGIYAETAMNSTKIIGGRIQSNDIGLDVNSTSDLFVSVAFEKNHIGFRLNSCVGASISQCRFEGSARTAGGLGTVDLVTGAAGIIMSNCLYCYVYGGHFSASNDVIKNYSTTSGAYGTPQTQSIQAQYGLNLFNNANCDQDSDANGVPDGFSFVASAGVAYSIDPTVKYSGLGSFLINVTAGATRRDGYVVFPTIIGDTYSMTIRYHTDTNNGWNFRVGNGTNQTNHSNQAFALKDNFSTLQLTFTATATSTYLTIFMNTSTAASGGKLWIDALSITNGSIPLGIGSKRNISLDISTTTNRPDLSLSSVDSGRMLYNGTTKSPEISIDKTWRTIPTSLGVTGGTVPPVAGAKYVEVTIGGVLRQLLIV